MSAPARVREAPPRVARGRIVAFAVIAVLAVAGGGVYVLRNAQQSAQRTSAAAASEAARPKLAEAAVLAVPHLVVRNTALGPSYGALALVPLADPAGPRATTGLSCERVYAVRSGGLCLNANRGVVTKYTGRLFDRGLRPTGSVTIVGAPSRTRLSPDGTLATSTVFISGHSYLDTGFSTVTEIVDTATGRGLGNLETWRTVKDGATYRSPDVNFWGVTFASADLFYATVGTKGTTYLVRGDVAARTLTVLRENAECPSVSPDGRKVAFKKASGSTTARRWRFTVLDLATGVETPLPEARSIDDQLAWLDDEHVLYGVPRGAGGSDVWVSPLAGGTPRILVPDAESPAVVRP